MEADHFVVPGLDADRRVFVGDPGHDRVDVLGLLGDEELGEGCDGTRECLLLFPVALVRAIEEVRAQVRCRREEALVEPFGDPADVGFHGGQRGRDDGV